MHAMLAADRYYQLLRGYADFRREDYHRQRERYERLAVDGQSPKVMVIACSDSRVDPATVFHAAPGEMFVLRHIAALVPPCERDGKHHSASAAIEYAVNVLEVNHVVIFGHGGCGGISASLTGCFDHCREGDGGFVHHWMDIIADERDRLLGSSATCKDPQLALELAAIRRSIGNLRGFPHVTEREREGTLAIHGAHFDIRRGELRLLEPDRAEFALIEPRGLAFLEDGPTAAAI